MKEGEYYRRNNRKGEKSYVRLGLVTTTILGMLELLGLLCLLGL
jgi:hypothetical protein